MTRQNGGKQCSVLEARGDMVSNILGWFCFRWWEKVGRQLVKGGREGEKREEKISLIHHRKKWEKGGRSPKFDLLGFFYTVYKLNCSETLGEKVCVLGL